MGQKLGKARLVPEAEPFSNLSRKAITLLWRVFNDIADGFGISKEELEEICSDLKDEVNVSRLAMTEKTGALFTVFDTDKNGLIDALEFMSCLAAISGMRTREIIEFILTSYDFDGTQQLSIDEVTLALKSASTGICKIYGKKFPREEMIESLVSEVFRSISGDASSNDSTLFRISIIADALHCHPDICSWYDSFGTPIPSDLLAHDVLIQEIDYSQENPIKPTSSQSSEWALTNKVWLDNISGKSSQVSQQHQHHHNAPWKDVAATLTPSSYASTHMTALAPDCSADIAWVYGYQAEKSKNNLRYTSSKGQCIVYHVGRYGVVYGFDSHKQSIFSGHQHEILCLAIHTGGELVATGESAELPRLIVWSTVTNAIHFSEKGFHRNGVVHTAFSSDGRQLASIGLDVFNSVAVHLWKENQLLYTCQVDKGKCLACAFLPDNHTLVVGGDSYLYLWSKSNEGYIKRRSNTARNVKLQPVTCIASIELADSFLTGTVSGLILLWTDVNCLRHVKAHQGAVNVIYSSPHGILSGGKDARIRLWTHRLEPGATFDMSHFGLQPSIRSVCMSQDGSSILFGTRGAEIYEVSAVDGSDLRGGAIASGHSHGLLRTIAVHPSRPEFASVGDDRCLRVWDTTTRSLLKIATFDCDARSVCYGPLGDVIAVGLGGDRSQNHPKVGAYVILNEEDLSVIHEAKDSNTPITVVSYSPEGETLAIGVEDGMIFLYAVHDDYELVGRCVRHTVPILHIDFSIDGEWLRTNDRDGELFFFNTDSASLQSNAAAMRDVKWLTNSAVYSWPTLAVHNHLLQNETITTSSVPPNILLAANSNTATRPIPESSTYDYIACGTSYGYICLFSYPCIPHDAEYHRIPAHAGSISEVRFSSDSQYLITCGNNDRCLVQWKCRVHNPPAETDPDAAKAVDNIPEYQESEDYGLEMRGRSDIEEDIMVAGCNIVPGILNNQTKPPVHQLNQVVGGDLSLLAEDEVQALLLTETRRQAQLADSMNVWLEGTVEPNNPPLQNTSPPDVTMRLEYVHGYKGQHMRNNIRYNDREEIVYCTASLGVVMDRTSKTQKFFQGHSQSISSFTCSRNGKYAATGDIGQTPRVLVWDTRSCTTLRILPDTPMKAVISLAFSNSSDLLAVVSLDNDHTISVYDWRNNLLLCRGANGSKRIVQISFSDDDRQILSCGIKEIKVWNLSTWSLVSVNQTITDGGRTQPFLCCTYFANTPTVGTVDGHFYVFQQNSLHHAIKAHTGGVHSLHVSLSGDQLVSGGKDGLIKIWNTSLDCMKELAVDNILPVAQPSVSSRVRSVCFSKDSQFLLVGTRGAEIFEVRISNSSLVGSKPLMQSHGCRELYGLATHPTRDEFITSGDDATIRLWDTNACTQMRCIRMDSPSRTIAYSPDGRLVAVGFGASGRRNRNKSSSKDGAFVVLGANDLKMVHEGKDSNEAIKFVKFSNDSKILAVGSDDSKIYLYNVRDHYSRRCTINCHRAPVVSADFSNDNSFIMSIDITKRICYSETTSGAHIPSPSALRDQKWATWSSPVGWPVKGLWAIQPPGSEPCSVQRSWGGMLLACGNTDGRIFVVHNPCQDISGFVGDNGHAGPVSQIAWIAGDTSIISIGSKDHSICQWRLVYDNNRESGDEGGISCDDSELERDGGNDVLIQNVSHDEKSMTLSGAQQQAWMSNVTPPTHVKDDIDTTPAVTIEIDHVHGIRSGDCRNGIKYNDDGNIVFFASRLGIIYNRKTHQQRAYDGHRHPLISLDVGVGGKIVATGELSYNPEIHFWDARTATQLSVVRDIHRNGVISLSFSPSGTTLATLGQDTLHSVVILKSCTARWLDDVFVSTSVNVSLTKMFWIYHSDESCEYPIIAGGTRCIYYFKSVGKSLEKLKGTFGRKRKIQSILCAVEISISGRFLNTPSANRPSITVAGPGSSTSTGGAGGGGTSGGENESKSAPDNLEKVLLTGTVTGHVYFWLNQRIKTTLTAHDAPIYALCSLNHYTGGRFATGGKDGLVKIWSESLQLLHTYNLQTFSPSPYSLSCHSLVATHSSSKIAIGLRSGEIYEVTLGTNSAIVLSESHSYRQLHGLCMNPANLDEYVTVGDDGVVRVWSLSQRRCIRRSSVEVAGRCVGWSPDGTHIAIGIGGDPTMNTKDGAIMILASSSLDVIFEDRKAKFTISDLKYSPSGSILVVASRDGRVYLHDCTAANTAQQYKLLSVIPLELKDAYVTHIDFNSTSTILKLSTSTCELLHYDLGEHPHHNTQLIPLATIVRDELWATNHVPYGWLIKGVWKSPNENIEVCALDTTIFSMATKRGLIAASYGDGEVKIFNYPCQNIGTGHIKLQGIASYSPSVRFSLDGNYLLVLDASARSIIQYRVIRG